MKNAQERRMLAVSALIAAALLLFFSRCSPLYPTNPWGEAKAFFTVGRGMLAGKLPYRDLALNAGPLVYGLHALAALVSPDGFTGVWLIEIAALAAALYFSWKAAMLLSGREWLSMGCAAFAGLLLVSGRAFVYGDTVEEFALPLQMWSLCDLLAYLKDEQRRMSLRRLALHGFMAGCVYCLKYTLMGVHLAFIGVIAVDSMIRERDVERAFAACAAFVVGAAVSLVPWMAYFSVNGALDTFFSAYPGDTIRNIVQSAEPLRDAIAALGSGAIHNPAAALALLCGAGWLLRRLAQRRWNAACTAAAVSFVCAAFLAYIDGSRYRFSPMAMGAFLLLCAGPLVQLAQQIWNKRRRYALLTGCIAAACAVYSCAENDNLPFIGYPARELPQAKFAEIIRDEGGSVLTFNFPDGGFYLAADVLPEFREFADSDAYNRDDVYNGQWNILDAWEAEWVVSRSAHVPNHYYTLAAQASSPYDSSTVQGKGAHQYYLYRRSGMNEFAEK